MNDIRKSLEQNNSLRKMIEQSVIACNNVLAPAVSEMDIIILLRNCHPTFRDGFALQLYRNGYLAKPEAQEFCKIL